MIEVLLVEDHPAVRQGLTALLRCEPGIVPRATAAGVEDAGSAVEAARFHVVVADFHLGDGDGLALCRRIKRLREPPAVLLYSAYAGPDLALLAHLSGADGLVSKSAPPDELFDAIRAVARGQRLVPHPEPERMAGASETLDPEHLPILGMLVEGTPLPEVADVLRMERECLDEQIETMVQRLAPRLQPAWR